MLFCGLVQRRAPTHFVQRQGLPSITDTAFICEGEWKVLTAGWKGAKEPSRRMRSTASLFHISTVDTFSMRHLRGGRSRGG